MSNGGKKPETFVVEDSYIQGEPSINFNFFLLASVDLYFLKSDLFFCCLKSSNTEKEAGQIPA